MVSIIVCTYNRDKYLGRTLQLLRQQCEGQEVIIVDNNSTDSTAAICHEFGEFRYVLEPRQGLSNARNRGVAEATGEWLLFLDDDAFIQPGYLVNLKRQMEAHPEMVAFGGRIDPMYESGSAPDWMSSWSYSWVSALDKGDRVCPFEGTEYPIGANMGVRADLARLVQGFNPNLGRSGKNTMGGEEKDFFNKVRALNRGAILYLPDVQVQHCIPESRTTREFIARLGDGVGASERQRTLDIGRICYLKRLFQEAVKWGGTLVLWCRFALSAQKPKGDVLVLFRYHVSKQLVSKVSNNS